MIFTVDSEQRDGGINLLLAGELDVASAGRVEEAVQRACNEGCEELLLDLGELTFLDSTGVRALLEAVNVCAAAYCRLEIAPSRHPGPATTLKTLGLDRLLPWQPGSSPAPEAG